MLLRLRIALPDRPGALGAVTQALGVAGADIIQVVVLDRGEERAVDDFTVSWPDAAPREHLLRALDEIPDIKVEGAWATREAPGTYPELEVLKFLTTAGDRALATLVDAMPVIFSADWAACAADGSHDVVCASWRAPESVRFPDLVPARPVAATLESGVHVVNAPLPPLALTLVLARVEGPAFHRIEVARLTRILDIFLLLPAIEQSAEKAFRSASQPT
ncbi:ACT domain-containing protein [Herbidospora yilanensis]|uniref:ACT domain-containing protein n=1 Tax=Herbidospora yilanensis TaxID=354426 RepID=UPI000781D455|nr:ACT domain-containing protein [Herbidospora yilanensis]